MRAYDAEAWSEMQNVAVMPTYEERSKARRVELESALAEFVRVAMGFPDVSAVYVFGSLGRGEVGPTSDLDVLVVRETEMQGARRAIDLAEATTAVLVPLDLVVVTPAEFRDSLPVSSFGRTILRDARRVDAA